MKFLQLLVVILIFNFTISLEDWEDQSLWGDSCQTGLSQSPMDITTVSASLCPSSMSFQILLDDNTTYTQLKPEDENVALKTPFTRSTIVMSDMSGASQQFKALQYHFHRPSQHTINGQRYDLEMHVVHKSAAGQLAVFGVLFSTDITLTTHGELNSFNLDASENINTEFPLALCAQKVYHYHGSLTTPPCSQNVMWFVSANVLKISESDLQSVYPLINHGKPNSRVIQLANNRKPQIVGEICSQTLKTLCETYLHDTANPIGIVLVVAAILAGVFLKSQIILYFVFALQTISLISLVEADWHSGLNELLGSSQYLMIFSVMGFSNKDFDTIYLKEDLYKLLHFLKSVNLYGNIAPLAAVLLIVVMFMVRCHILLHESKHDWFSESTIKKIMLGLQTTYFLTIQQALTIIYTSIRLDNHEGGKIVIIVLYFITLIYFIVLINLQPLPYFRSRTIQNIMVFKKIILPIFIIIQYQYHYLLFPFMFLSTLAEIICLVIIPQGKPKFRSYFHRGSELILIIILAVFYIIDQTITSLNSTYSIEKIGTSIVIWFYSSFFIEILLSVRLILPNKLQSKGQEKFQDYEETKKISKSSKVQPMDNVENTLDNLDPKNQSEIVESFKRNNKKSTSFLNDRNKLEKIQEESFERKENPIVFMDEEIKE